MVLSVRAWCKCHGSLRLIVVVKLDELLGDRYADLEVLNSVEKTSYVLGSEVWQQNFT